ncbi:Yip1 family protein [Streptomyces milbemycinicus]|uniref:Yip1 family protein n=1 Tax=Streptomyces milbemycinicus TaxID=476552 RepID=A0ABW8LWI6_9ACTN
MAGFRIGRGRDSRSAQQGQQQPPQQQPYGRQPPPHGGQPPQWQQPASHGEPEYFGGQDPHYGPPQGHGPGPGHGQGGGSYSNNNPGHTQQFSVGEAPDAYDPYGQDPGYGPGPGPGSYDDGYGNTYRAGASTAPPAGPRLPWKQLLSGIVLRPSATFWQMRDYAMWGPALIVTFVYGLLVVFGFDQAREDVLNASMGNSIPYIAVTGVAVVISGLILGAVTHTLARQLGGDGSYAPTIGLSMLIMSITDAPRLLFALFLGGDSPTVQVLGWATWLAAGALFTSMVSKSHDLPWQKALGASAIQLIALLSLLKLGTL